MNCQGVRALIDATPFAPANPSQIEAAERHIRVCAECRALQSATEALQSELAALPEPEPPDELSAIIQARISQHEESVAASDDVPLAAPTESQGDRFAWAALLAGVTISLAALAYGCFVRESALSMTVPVFHRGPQTLIEIPSSGPAALVLAAGLVFYVVGLCTPRRSR